MNMRELLERMIEEDASDLHLKVGSPPGLRVHGDLEPIEEAGILTPEDTQRLTDELLDERRRQIFDEEHDIDFSAELGGVARFRVNLFYQRETRGAVLRRIPIEVPVLEEMGFPEALTSLCRKPRGLVLVTGPTGSGKSTTLAAMVDYINRHYHSHILTLEDPIEFVHMDKKCFVNQREVGQDTKSFNKALRAALREDPDYILVGEMRDLETIGLAITAAETGHLVFGTLHTTSAIQTVDRIIDVFPHEAQQQVRMQLSVALQGVISQTLLPKIGGGRVAAQEIMIATDAVRSCIREGKTPQLINMLQTGARQGMQTLETALAELVMRGLVTPDDAVSKANNPDQIHSALAAEGGGVPRRPMAAAAARPSARPAAPAARPQAPPPARPQPQPPAASPPPSAGGGSGTTGPDDFERFRARRQRGDV
ncbi:MAG: type IV pilus twitching motility protein PilT [Planctomycetes bacterium]|nr:type IV pilus twitching motility protein PilT [Planctomycetota bacterium]MCB9891560.1 type IV pilus twitching motility protein PilT [Planctomycetota bacterium]